MGRGALHTIRRRIDSTESTQHITHAMEMVAAAKVNKVFRLWKGFTPYLASLRGMIDECVTADPELEHPLVEKKKVKEEKASRASSSHDTKAEAVDRAKELAKNQDLGQVVIHKQDGTIQTEHTYGKDPYPPKG